MLRALMFLMMIPLLALPGLLTGQAAGDDCLVLVEADYRAVAREPWVAGAAFACIGEDFLIVVAPAGATELPATGRVLDCAEQAEGAYLNVWTISPVGRERARQLGRIVFARGDYLLVRRAGDPPADFTLEGIRAVTPLRALTPPAAGPQVPGLRDRDPLVAEIVAAVAEAEFQNAIQDLENLVTRNARTAGYAHACSNVRAAFMAYGLDTVLQEYVTQPWYGDPFLCWNVIGEKVGSEYPDQIYIVCGHLDSTAGAPWQPEPIAPGGDDNASGSAVVLEAARVMANLDFRYTIRFVCFGAEEQGLCGSTYYAGQAAAAGENILGVINTDMILYGPPGLQTLRIYYNTQSQSLAQALEDAAAAYIPELDVEINYNPNAAYSDHYPFWVNGYAAVQSSERGISSNPHYHTVNDRLVNYLSYFPFGTRCAQAAIAVLASLAEPLPSSGAQEETAAAPARQWFLDVHPNPARDRAQVLLHSPAAGDYQVGLYDVLGRTLRERRGTARTAGEITVGLGLEGIGPGIYFIRAGGGGQADVARLVVTR